MPPDTLDITREPNPQVAFGYGMHTALVPLLHGSRLRSQSLRSLGLIAI
jgi:hypothetical protein